MKKFVAAGLLLASVNAYAIPIGFLDLGTSTVDLSTGLEFLDTSATAGLSSYDVYQQLEWNTGLGAAGWWLPGYTVVSTLIANWFGSDIAEVLDAEGIYTESSANVLFSAFVDTIGDGGSLGGSIAEVGTLFVSANPMEITYRPAHMSQYEAWQPMSGHWLVRHYTPSSVPEPATFLMLGLGLLGLAGVKKYS